MIWRWLICSSLALAVSGGAEVMGSVALRDSREASVRKNGDFSGVVVSLQPVQGASVTTVAARHAVMTQKNKTFTPHVLAIEVGTMVDFPNLDPIFHNAFSSYNGQIFDLGLYPPGQTRSVRFTRPGIVRVFCNIHPAMSAVIVVLNTPYFATTSRDGQFTIEAPAGDYELHCFHERATEDTLQRLSRPVSITAPSVRLPPISISESGYLPVPHTNKYGHPYPAEPDDRNVYPGVRK